MDGQVNLALQMDDGSVAIMAFAVQSRSPTLPPGARWLNKDRGLWYRAPNDDNIRAELSKAFPGVNQLGIKRPSVLSYQRIESVPAIRDYRNSWELRDGVIAENLEKAKAIHRDKLRNQRTARLLPLDVGWSRAMATGDASAARAVEAQRQALRDATDDPRIEGATSIEELRQITLP